jgi:hypothetical protein
MRRYAYKKRKLDAKGLLIGSPLLFICDAAYVKSVSQMLRDRQLRDPYFLYATLRM